MQAPDSFHLNTPFLLTIIALLIAAGVGHLVGRHQKAGTGKILIEMFLAGVLASRIAFIATGYEKYSNLHWSVFDIRDGGFTLWAGIMAGLLVAVWRARQRPKLRRPLAMGLIAGALAWNMSGAPGMLAMSSQQNLPMVALMSLAGAPASLAALSNGKPMVVNLWASWCPPCRQEMPALALAQHQDTSVTFVFANQGEDGATVQNYLNRMGSGMTNILLDPGTELGRAIGSMALPTTLFYDARGRMVDIHVGALSAASLARQLNKLHATGQQSPAPPL